MTFLNNSGYTANFESERVVAIPCTCSTALHLLTITTRHERGKDYDDGPELAISTQLHSPGTFWQKLKLAVRFLLGKTEPYGHWDVTLVSKTQAEKIRDLLDQFLKGIHDHEIKIAVAAPSAGVAPESK